MVCFCGYRIKSKCLHLPLRALLFQTQAHIPKRYLMLFCLNSALASITHCSPNIHFFLLPRQLELIFSCLLRKQSLCLLSPSGVHPFLMSLYLSPYDDPLSLSSSLHILFCVPHLCFILSVSYWYEFVVLVPSTTTQPAHFTMNAFKTRITFLPLRMPFNICPLIQYIFSEHRSNSVNLFSKCIQFKYINPFKT